MRPTLAAVLPGAFTEEEIREAYKATPLWVRRLFAEHPAELDGDGWLVRAIMGGSVPVLTVPAAILALVRSLDVPTIACDPCKSPGKWSVYANHTEWYVSTAELVEMPEGELTFTMAEAASLHAAGYSAATARLEYPGTFDAALAVLRRVRP